MSSQPAVSFDSGDHNRSIAECNVFGHEISDDTYRAILKGLSSPATASVSFNMEADEKIYPIQIKVTAGRHARITLRFTPSIIYLHSIFVDQVKRGTGLGRESLRQLLANVQRVHQFQEVRARAVRQPHKDFRTVADEFGYYAMAKWGFDAKLSDEQRGKLPDSLCNAAYISDLMKTPIGRDYWKEHGETINVSLSLNREDRSWRVFSGQQLGETD